MATKEPVNAPVNQFERFDNIATQILDTFQILIDQLIVRRDTLLAKLQQMKDEYVNTETTRKSAVIELERAQQHMLEMSIKVNPNLKIHEQATELYKKQLDQMETPTELPLPSFSFRALSELETRIAEFGEVKEELDYSQKKEPVLAVGKYGTGNNELKAAGLALDEPNQLIYVADCYSSRIQVVSCEGNLLKIFGQGILKRPWGIAVTENSIFVTDRNLHALLQFSKTDYKLKKRTGTKGAGEGELNWPYGLCIDFNGDVYVTDSDNHRVSVFTKDLQFSNCIATQQLCNPTDVKVTQNRVVVLEWSADCVHFYSRSGDLLSSCVTQGKDGMVQYPHFFCLDTAGNVLITDHARHAIKIFSPSGQLIHEIGKEGHGRGELYQPYGICISEIGTIFVISWNKNFCLQSF